MNFRRFSSPILRKAWIPYFILLFTLLISLFTMYLAGLETKENDGLRFVNIVERTQGTLNNQLVTYITLLEGTSGLFAASENVTKNEFQIYVERLNLKQQYPGIQGIGYIEQVSSLQKETLVNRLQSEGLVDYRIWPEIGQTEYTPIIYLEPSDERNSAALGYDMSTETLRREAMQRAVITAEPSLSNKLTLVQDIGRAKQAGFLIFLPVYKGGIIPKTPEQREADLQGFVYSPFRADDFLRGILGGEKSPQIDFRVYDGRPSVDSLMHDSKNFGPVSKSSYAPRFTQEEEITIGGKTWTVAYSSNQAFDATSDIWLVPFVLFFGILTSGVLFILSKAQYEAGRKAEVSESNLHFVAEAGKILGSSLDYKKTIATVAQMGTAILGDWCSVDVKKDGAIEQIAIAHKDPEKIKWARKYRKLHPPTLKEKGGVSEVLRSGKTVFYPVITESMIQANATSQEELEVMQELKISSVMIVPLKVHTKVVGAMSYISTDPKRRFTQADVSVAEEIAQRAAMAIEHARLFMESEQAVKSRDDFISVASHELKTPVTSLKMYLQVVSKQLQKKGEKELMTAMNKMDMQVNKLTVLIGDLLNVSRIQIGRLDFNQELFDLEELARETVESIQPSSIKHKLLILGSIKKKILGDRERIGQVITNLLTNAIKYSPDSKKVEVMLEEDKESVTVRVRDFGIGIDEKHIAKIFDRFYRVSDSNEKTFPGLGIGLFITYEIISRHGGTLEVQSLKGEGSTFSFTIPHKR